MSAGFGAILVAVGMWSSNPRLPAQGGTATKGLPWLQNEWHFVVGSSVKLASCEILSNTAPLLEEKRYASDAALTENGGHPFLVHRTCFRPRFSSDDGPVNSIERQCIKRTDQRLQRQKPYYCGNSLQVAHAT